MTGNASLAAAWSRVSYLASRHPPNGARLESLCYALGMLTLREIWLVAACLLASACSSSGKDPSTDTDSDLSGGVSCTTDARVEQYTAGMEKAGSDGALSFKLAESAPAPPSKGSNTFTLAVTDANGDPADVELSVDLKMPDHGHGTSVVPKITFDAD